MTLGGPVSLRMKLTHKVSKFNALKYFTIPKTVHKVLNCIIQDGNIDLHRVTAISI